MASLWSCSASNQVLRKPVPDKLVAQVREIAREANAGFSLLDGA